jgi:hypothetical protein
MNSAELYMKTVKALHATGQTMLNGATDQSVTDARETVRLAKEMLDAIEQENRERINGEAYREAMRIKPFVAELPAT